MLHTSHFHHSLTAHSGFTCRLSPGTIPSIPQQKAFNLTVQKVFHSQGNTELGCQLLSDLLLLLPVSTLSASFPFKSLEESFKLSFWCPSSAFEEREAIQEICLHAARRLPLLCDKPAVQYISKSYFHKICPKEHFYIQWGTKETEDLRSQLHTLNFIFSSQIL